MGLTYGEHLPDQVDCISALSDAQIDLLADIRDLYTQRAAIEREYAVKLQALQRKAVEKKARKIAALVVGGEPAKAYDQATIQKSTIERAYSSLLGSVEDAAGDHVALADGITINVVEGLKGVERRHEEAKKKQTAFFQKLLSDRDKVYAERLKSKQKYDEECEEVETYRQKQDRAADDKHADRAARQYEQQQADMHTAKNAYLISTAVANRVKDKFYREDLPALEDQFQTLHTQLMSSLVAILSAAQRLHNSHSTALQSRAASVDAALQAVDATADQDLFIDHNIRPFGSPGDWTFEPCATHYDTGEMSLDPAPKVFIQNKLGRARGKLGELAPLMDGKGREAAQLEKSVEVYAQQTELGERDKTHDSLLDAQHQLTLYSTSECILRCEVETVEGALAGDEGAQQPHSFKSSSFSIPTTCACCKTSIWGLSRQGKTCKACGISVHAKCELKMPAECGGKRGHGHTASVLRASTRTSTSAGSSFVAATPTPSSFVQSDSATSVKDTAPNARVVFEFAATSPFELSVQEGAEVSILEEDDGSGWVKVDDGRGGRGLVPASYVVLSDGAQHTPTASDAGTWVKAIYDYSPQGPDEIGFREGEIVRLSEGPGAGQNYAEGWWEGHDDHGRKGIFPSNYVQLV